MAGSVGMGNWRHLCKEAAKVPENPHGLILAAMKAFVCGRVSEMLEQGEPLSQSAKDKIQIIEKNEPGELLEVLEIYASQTEDTVAILAETVYINSVAIGFYRYLTKENKEAELSALLEEKVGTRAQFFLDENVL